ncbi:arsenic resistance N-acetyltransferase ArsN2 [Telmatospirillum sp.]|uniref:arsenic resistance N-acetyltransferase ArsN2 n=1 Tax=Telmatospirillum sp. TaxID=2079197 RepID=UPI0028424966|nr:arsenic resistance N-acetyltransferase ArsN2 [Telmatospirillum sp.]MDR3438412.1 arsenic resistance N-acetyltransferase ArsN2 [Telmatospirillum sp.]
MDEPTIDEIPGSAAELATTLAGAGLPVDDLDLPGRRFFRFREDGRLIGFIGWEASDDGMALLRSLVVVPALRHKGLGRTMTNWALTRLAELGVGDVYMLTATAESFAAQLGFVRVERALAPPSIRQSHQFAGLCPASAILLQRSLP